MTFEGTAEPTAVDHTLVTLTASVHRLVEQLADGGLDPLDQSRLIGFMQDFEQLRNLMAVVDHYTIAAAQRLDLPTVLCQGNMLRVLTSGLGLSKAEAGRRVRAAEEVGPRTSMLGEVLPPVRP